MKLSDWLIIIGLGVIWGGSFLFNAILIRELGPLSVSLGRVGVAAIGCWAYLLATKVKLPTDWRIYAGLTLLGLINFSVPFALFPLAQNYVNVGIAGIVNAMTPIMVVIVSHFWPGGEKANPAKSVGVAIAFGGVALIALPALQRGGQSEIWAIGLMMLATLMYGIALNYTRSFKRLNPSFVATIALSGATIALVPVVLLTEGVPHIQTAQSWGALLYIGLIATSFTFLVMYRILERVGATNMSTSTFIAPISAIFLGYIVLNEQIQTVHILGMLAIFIGILAIDGRLYRALRPNKLPT
ncbi:DMT family transporter [Maritalea porphyrae]|uniref:DMT family transporter n=1 Tax=Maritalea porphyrae TaxID=880732 RepID=UPI0022AF7C41|nr:DMT family transporter [Maritalea porphyrae]MCZ4272932.1 DMT family transporter [Maritalea porphyrae]